MSDDTLRKLLARLHERLSSGGVDPAHRSVLQRAIQDIEQRLGTDANASEAARSTGPAHATRLEQLAVQFEADHPAIAQLLRQIGTLLGQAGI
jgi:hypothetical protein